MRSPWSGDHERTIEIKPLPAARRRGERNEKHLPGLLTVEVSEALWCGHRVHDMN
jgi:hypothetical protein